MKAIHIRCESRTVGWSNLQIRNGIMRIFLSDFYEQLKNDQNINILHTHSDEIYENQ